MNLVVKIKKFVVKIADCVYRIAIFEGFVDYILDEKNRSKNVKI